MTPGWWIRGDDRRDARRDIDERIADEPGSAAEIARRDQLRDRRARAWEDVRANAKPRDYGPTDALALSTAEAELDAAEPWPQRPVPGRASLADLPRRHWWYLFVEPAEWHRGPLAIDRRRSPGSYAALMAAVESIARPGDAAPLTPEAYEALHATTTYGVFRSDGEPATAGFVWAPTSFPLIPLHDPSAATVELLAKSLAELKAEGLATWSDEIQRQRGDTVAPWLRAVLEPIADVNPHSKPVHLAYRRQRDDRGVRGHRQWLYASTDYGPREASRWVAQWLAEYGIEQAKVSGRLGGPVYHDALAAPAPSLEVIDTLRPICRLVRRLVVGHVFADGNTRVPAMLLLNRLLREQGLPPATLHDISVFDGRAPVDELAKAVFDGQKRFQDLVAELVAREPAPAAAAAPAAPWAEAPQQPRVGAPWSTNDAK